MGRRVLRAGKSDHCSRKSNFSEELSFPSTDCEFLREVISDNYRPEALGLSDVGDAVIKGQISIVSFTILVVNLFPGF